MALLSLRGVSLAFGGPRLLDRVNLQIERGERVCLLGRNGEGKSTLLRLIRGEIPPDEGEVISQQGLRIGHLPQDVPKERASTVADEVAGAIGAGGASAPDYGVDSVISRRMSQGRGQVRPRTGPRGGWGQRGLRPRITGPPRSPPEWPWPPSPVRGSLLGHEEAGPAGQGLGQRTGHPPARRTDQPPR